MATLCICTDKTEPETLAEELRAANRNKHFAYIESIMKQVLVAGPIPAEDGKGQRGSAFLYVTDDPEEALALLHDDPYYRSGLYETVEVLPFLPAAGRWLGGGIWQPQVKARIQAEQATGDASNTMEQDTP